MDEQDLPRDEGFTADEPTPDDAVSDAAADPAQASADAVEPEEDETAQTEPADDASPELVEEIESVFSDAEQAVEAADVDAAEAAPAGDAATEGAEEEVEDLWQPGEWYVVHTYAGYENKVKADLETRVASMNMEDSIFDVVIPMEEVMEIKSGKKQMVPRKVFPGYLLVRMELNDDSWYVVRNTPGVTGFVGSGTKPIPLSEREVDKILQRGKPGETVERPKPTAEWQVNDNVRVTTGPFANFQGHVSDVDGERQKVKVLVNIFGRETPVELSFDQIAKV